MIGTIFTRACACVADVRCEIVARRVVPACSACGALYTTEAQTREEIMRAALVELSTKVHYMPRDKTGEESTRRVQLIASEALRRADEA